MNHPAPPSTRSFALSCAASFFMQGALFGDAAHAQQQPQPQQQARPPYYGALEAYPVPRRYGGPLEMDQCYFYGKRVWDMVQGRAMNSATVRQINAQLEATLGAQAVAEDKADLELYWNGATPNPEVMAGTRFYRCGARLKLPLKESHGQSGAQCYGGLRAPAQAASARKAGQNATQARAALKSANPAWLDADIAAAVSSIYAQPATVAATERLLKERFLGCMVKLGGAS